MALESAYKKFISGNKVIEPIIPEPLFTEKFEFTSVFDGQSLVPVTNSGWVFDGTQSRSAGWKSSAPGSVLEFEISGEIIYLSCWKINGPMGKAKVTVDGGNPVDMDAWFDQTWGGYRYMLPVAKNLTPGNHTVRVELLAEKNAQSTGTEFKVLCLGSAGIKK